jgi:hypothetical protein
MTVDQAVSSIETIINNTLEEYNQSPDSNDANGNRIPHPLDIVEQDDILFALDMSLKDTALRTVPVSLLETSGSTASELRRVSTDYYVRVPATPALGQALDIDDGLAYAVTFRALGYIWRQFSEYEQRADVIVTTYDQAYRDYIRNLIAGTAASTNEAYVRFSANGTDWHDSYTSGDIYISFKRIETDTWTPAIRFVGADGQDGADGTPCSDTMFTQLQDTPASYTDMAGKIPAVKSDESGLEFVDPPSGGGGASSFTDLDDTPASLTADKWVKVNAAGDAIEFVDPPTGGSVTQFGDKPFYDDSATGSIDLDTRQYNSFYLYPSGDLTINFSKFDDGVNDQASAMWGSVYTFAVVNAGNYSIAFDGNETIHGDASILADTDTTKYPLTVLRMYYDGFKWVVLSRTEVPDYQP